MQDLLLIIMNIYEKFRRRFYFKFINGLRYKLIIKIYE